MAKQRVDNFDSGLATLLTDFFANVLPLKRSTQNVGDAEMFAHVYDHFPGKTAAVTAESIVHDIRQHENGISAKPYYEKVVSGYVWFFQRLSDTTRNKYYHVQARSQQGVGVANWTRSP